MNWKINIVLMVLLSFLRSETKAQIIVTEKEPLIGFDAPKLRHLDSTYLTKFPIVDFDLNYFQFYSNESPNWDFFFSKIEKMEMSKMGKLNLYHAGGSHLQADIYTHEVRTKFQTQDKALPGERNWVFPYDLARTNNPWNYEFSSPNRWERYRSVVKSQAEEIYGLSGIKIISRDSVSSMSFRYDKTDIKTPIQKIRIYHNKGDFPFLMEWGVQEVLVKKEIRDSSIGYTEVSFTRPFTAFQLKFTRSVAGSFPLEIYGLQLMNEQPGISYSNIGTNGAALYNYNACVRLEEELRLTPPDFFAFSIGTNDGNMPADAFDPQVYKDNLEQLMLTVLRANPNCALLLTVPNDSYYLKSHLNPNIAKERDVIRELAAEYKCPVWDLYGIMGELGSSKKWYRQKLMRSDLVHFTKEGYHLKGDLYFDAFEKAKMQFEQRGLKTAKLK